MRRVLFLLTFLLAPLMLFAEVGDDGLHDAPFLRETFKDLGEDYAEAAGEGRAMMVIIEQRGCIYCKKMYEEVFVDPRVEKLLMEDYFVVQINMDGATEVTDFDGTTMTEAEMVDFWGFSFTPTMMIFPADAAPEGEASEAALTIVPGALEVEDTLSLLMWGADPEAARSMSLQEFHAARTGS